MLYYRAVNRMQETSCLYGKAFVQMKVKNIKIISLLSAV